MTTDLNDLRELREIVMGEFNTDYGGGNVGLTPAGEKMVEIINAAIADQSRQVGDVADELFEAKMIINTAQFHVCYNGEMDKQYRNAVTVINNVLKNLSAYRRPTAELTGEEVSALIEAGKPEPQYTTHTVSGNRPTADEVAEIDRAITELTDVMLGGISWKSQCLAITALHKMKGD